MSHFSRFRCALRPLAWAAAVTCIATPRGGGGPNRCRAARCDGACRPRWPPALAPSAQRERQRLEQLPGGTNLIQPQQAARWPPCAMRWITSPASCCKTFWRHRPAAPVDSWLGHPKQPGQSRCGAAARWPAAERGRWLFCHRHAGATQRRPGQRPPGGEHPHAQRHHPRAGSWIFESLSRRG